jgi:hypothetical protein
VQLHSILQACPVNNIVMAVKDRPLCRSVVLHKDRAGRLGIQVHSHSFFFVIENSSFLLSLIPFSLKGILNVFVLIFIRAPLSLNKTQRFVKLLK